MPILSCVSSCKDSSADNVDRSLHRAASRTRDDRRARRWVQRNAEVAGPEKILTEPTEQVVPELVSAHACAFPGVLRIRAQRRLEDCLEAALMVSGDIAFHTK